MGGFTPEGLSLHCTVLAPPRRPPAATLTLLTQRQRRGESTMVSVSYTNSS